MNTPHEIRSAPDEGGGADVMRSAMSATVRRPALLIAGLYVLVGCAWILFSDAALNSAVGGRADLLTRLQTFKGWFFVLASGGVLYVMLRWSFSRVRQTERQIAQSEARYHGVVESNVVGVYLWEKSGSIAGANQAFLAMTGYDRDDLREGRIDWSAMTPPEYAERDRLALGEAARRGVSAPYEKEFVGKGGGRVSVLLSAALFPDDPDSGIAVVIDITDRKRAEERAQSLNLELAHLNRELRSADRLKDQFLAVVSHELRTPITAIRLWAELLRTAGEDAALQREALGMIESSVDAQAQLIDDLLDVSRIISGNLKVEMVWLDLRPVVEQAVTSLEPQALGHGLKLEVRAGSEPVMVVGDGGRLRQVVLNLVANAIKFTPSGGRIEVTLMTATDDGLAGRARLTVRDTGQGIEPSFLPHVFEPFRQADPTTARRQGGLGIGLSISKSIVELHGGAIRVESGGAGQGATLIVDVPLASPAAATASTAPPEQEPESAATSAAPTEAAASSDVSHEAQELPGVQIILVEDHDETRRAAARLLRSQGAVVFTAHSGAEALELLDREQPDVLVSDIGMPGMDGIELIRRVREREASGTGTRIPAIALTAFAMADDRDGAIDAGYDGYLAKPIDFDQLVQKVKEATSGVGEPH